jgi:3-hydroxyisobutyrate dehydrogenase-like beta-hydroxyacid dehydrogenase
MNLAFIGLGQMGAAMARNLLRSGHNVSVYNRTRSKAESLAAEGARIASSVAEAAGGKEAVMTMLADDDAVEQTVFGEDGLVPSLKPGAVHIGCSTISTRMARRLTTEHAKRGQAYLSATVIGRPEAAEARKLIVVAAGPPDVIERCQPAFDAFGRLTFVAGAEPWQSNAVKLCGNFMIASMLESFSEAYATLRKSNIDPHLFLEVMNALFASPVYANYGRIIADQQFDPPGFALKLGLKDLRLALEAAEDCASPMPIASLIRDRFLSAIAHGQAESDWSSLSRVSARTAGLE